MKEFSSGAIFIDEDYSANDKFTALGNLYFIHNDFKAKIYNFNTELFETISGHQIYTGNIEDIPLKVKAKFPQDFFPDFKWSRKGFMKTRWQIGDETLDFTNVHLYHDESNFVALKSSPSPYVENRRKALEYTLKQLNTPAQYPQFFFGDFNFRLDLNSVVKFLTNNQDLHCLPSEESIISLKNLETKLEITIQRKHFSLSDSKFLDNRENLLKLLKHDKELDFYEGILFELPIKFVPSYPFTEKRDLSHYMATRCPAWCDRVLMNNAAKQILFHQNCSQVNKLLKAFSLFFLLHLPSKCFRQF